MRTSILALAVIVAVALLPASASLQDLGPTGPSPYDVVDNWMTPFAEDGYAWGSHAGVFAESPDRIFVGPTRRAAFTRSRADRVGRFRRLHRHQCTRTGGGPTGVAELHLHRRR